MVRIWNAAEFGRRSVATLALLAALLLAPPDAGAGYVEGNNAYQEGDYATAMKELRPLAEAGDANSEHAVGVMMAYGRGVEANAAMGAVWLTRAKNHGSVWAIYDLGVLFYSGEGALPVDATRAIMLFEESAAAGDFRGMFMLAMTYYMGEIVEANPTEAYYHLLVSLEVVPADHEWIPVIQDAIAKTKPVLEPQTLAWVEGRVRTWRSTHQ